MTMERRWNIARHQKEKFRFSGKWYYEENLSENDMKRNPMYTLIRLQTDKAH